MHRLTDVLRRAKDSKLEALRRVPLFAGFSKRSLVAVGRITDELDFAPGKTLIREGEPGRQFFIVLDGDLVVRRKGRKVNQLGSGDFFGEISLLSESAATATVETVADCRILVVTRASFKRLLRESSAIQMSVITALVARLPLPEY